MNETTHSLILLLVARLERISADSVWAHRASGVKGSLLRMMDKFEKGFRIREGELQRAIDLGFAILEEAAREKPAPEN